MRKSNLCFGAIYYWTVKFWVLFYLQQDFFFKNNNGTTVRMYYSTSKIRLDLTRLDEFLLHYSDNFHAFIYEGCHHTSPEITMPRLRVHFLRISKQV